MAPPASPAIAASPPAVPAPTVARLPRLAVVSARGFARGWRRYVVALLGWTAAGVVLLQQSYAAMQLAGRAPPLGDLLLGGFASMWLWALFTPAIMDLGRHFPVDGANWGRRVPLHLAAAAGFAVLDALVMWALRPSLCDCPRPALAGEFSTGLFANEASYLVLAALGMAARYAEQLRDREVAASRLAAELADARLAALNAQLRPHFLFNTLNAIAELVHVDAHAADRTVTALGGLLRRSLAAGERQEVPLREELACVDEYLAIVATRLDERLRVSTAIAPDALDAAVPSFLLQPLVENAVRHGIEPAPDGGRVEVAAWRDGTWLHVEVRDDGAGLAAAGLGGGALGGAGLDRAPSEAGSRRRDSGGHGLRTTRERLRHLYGDAHAFDLRAPRSGRGAVAAVRIPYTPSSATRAPG